MNQVRNTERLNQRELEAGISIEASWHNEYNDTAYIFFGSLPYELTEGDILIIFSQYGIPVHLKLVRDKETGKSKGFGYLKYEDQRSTVLAVDNLNGTKVLGRIIRVDHAYYEERERDEEYEKMLEEELKNDFADLDEEEDDVKVQNDEDDEFQDPLLLMQKKEESDKLKNKSRSHRHREHRSREDKHREDSEKERDRRHREHRDKDRDGEKGTHRSSHRSSHRERLREERSEHRERKHKDDQDHDSDRKEKRIRKDGESGSSRSHRHDTHREKQTTSTTSK